MPDSDSATKDPTPAQPKLWRWITTLAVSIGGTIAALGQVDAARDALYGLGLPFLPVWIWRSLGIFLLGLTVSTLFLRFKPTTKLLRILRGAAVVVLLVIMSGIIAHLRKGGHHWDGTLTVGIGFFEGEDGDPLHLERAVYDQVVARLRAYEMVRVIPLVAVPRKYESREDALRRIARWRGVELLVWGWYAVPEDSGTVTVNFEVTQPGFGLKNQRQQDIIPASDFQRFAVHGRLAAQVEYITLVSAGVANFGKSPASALDLLDKAIALPLYPDSVLPPAAVYQIRGLLNSLMFDMPAAAQDYRTAIRLGLRDPGIYYNLASALLYYAAPEEALAMFDTAAQLHPPFLSDIGYQLNRVGLFVKAGMLDSASIGCQRIDPLQTSRADSLLFSTLINCGLTYLKTGEVKRAASAFRKAQRIDPTHSFGNHYLGQTLTTLGDLAFRDQEVTQAIEYYREAARYLSHAVRIRPSRPTIRIDRFEARTKLATAIATRRGTLPDTGLFRRALRDLEVVDSLNADAPEGSAQATVNPMAYEMVINMYLHLQDPAGALKMFDKQLDFIGTGDTIIDVANLHLLIANSAQQLGDRATARRAINRMVMWYPNDHQVLFARSMFHERDGELFLAFQDIENALLLECGPMVTRIYMGSDLAPQSLLRFGINRLEAMRWEQLIGNYLALQQGRFGCSPRR
jgi:tetratricopeptide (TPR) repeat protein